MEIKEQKVNADFKKGLIGRRRCTNELGYDAGALFVASISWEPPRDCLYVGTNWQDFPGVKLQHTTHFYLGLSQM